MIATRKKGANYERWVAHRLAEVWPGAKRGYQFRGGDEQADVTGTPFHVEAKHRRNVSIQAAMQQAIDDSSGQWPVVVSRDNHGDDLVTMRLDDWLTLAARTKAATT
jgi:hypothetical protein